jgi:hypothetical protein
MPICPYDYTYDYAYAYAYAYALREGNPANALLLWKWWQDRTAYGRPCLDPLTRLRFDPKSDIHSVSLLLYAYTNLH